MKKISLVAVCIILTMALTACAGGSASVSNEASAKAATVKTKKSAKSKKRTIKMSMKIDNTSVKVKWNNNSAEKALQKMAKKKPVTISSHKYGGFEQVGDIGKTLPSNDKDTTTKAGDIVLYSGDQLVVFFGSNSWAYTRLGHITDKSASEIKNLLSEDEVTIAITAK